MNWPALVMGSLGSGLVAFGLWCRPRRGRRIPEMECLACGRKGLMGELAPGKPCCAPCREEIWAEVEGRKPVALAGAEFQLRPGAFTVIDCRPKDIPRFYPDRQQWAFRGALHNVEELEDELPFVSQAVARKERV